MWVAIVGVMEEVRERVSPGQNMDCGELSSGRDTESVRLWGNSSEVEKSPRQLRGNGTKV